LIDIFTYYAQLAFQVGEGYKNPPKPKVPLRQLIQEMPPEFNIQEAVDFFIRQHRVEEYQMDLAREQFEKLYNSGVFLFEGILDYESREPKAIIGIRLLVWDGVDYVDPNTLLGDNEEDDYLVE